MFRLNSISNKFALITLLLYLADFFSGGRLVNILALQPITVIEKMEFWRIISFPFAGSSLEGGLLFFASILFFGNKLEIVFHKAFFPIIILLLICLQGTIFTLLFWRSELVFAGMEGISIFILTLFSLLFYKNKLQVGYRKTYRIVSSVGLLAITWASSVALHYFIMNDQSIIYKSAYSAMFGISGGSLIFAQIKLARRLKSKKKVIIPEETILPRPEELSLALISQNEFRRLKKHLIEEAPLMDYNFPFSEDRLNEILEKIYDNGKESLSNDERAYLEEYSKRL